MRHHPRTIAVTRPQLRVQRPKEQLERRRTQEHGAVSWVCHRLWTLLRLSEIFHKARRICSYRAFVQAESLGPMRAKDIVARPRRGTVGKTKLSACHPFTFTILPLDKRIGAHCRGNSRTKSYVRKLPRTHCLRPRRRTSSSRDGE